ncbi:hypothetical protein MACH16_01120 [Marinomonas pontica]|uniref:Uncharacterized protein n=1 Tax=Marinomonas pontica TaxID=264739 RepID=A0ABN6WIV6_9GAMM|nr:hypothetical protein MACH16_01120 [Marinomonas pontica]
MISLFPDQHLADVCALAPERELIWKQRYCGLKHKRRVQAKSADDEQRPADELEEDGRFGFLDAFM